MLVPRWQADSACSTCYLCNIYFTIFNRRHHCRKCGKLVCGKCSAKQVRYFSNSYVLTAEGAPKKARSHKHYRTCDVCANEINMIRETLAVNSTPSPAQRTAMQPLASLSSASTMAGAKTTVLSPIKAVNLLKKSRKGGRRDPQGLHSDDSDANLCPVCGVNLWSQFSELKLSPETAFEPYIEAHVSQCLTAYDFTNDNMRLSSPPNGLNARNRMLVYNIPPFPEPSYETIKGSSPNSTGMCSNAENEISALTRSNATFIGNEKEALDEECVICLEHLWLGDKVGRLECLCVFHYKCIKDWFNKKSYAECPVHFLYS